jgi:hypothetical protein
VLPARGGAQVELRPDDGLHADAGSPAAALGRPADEAWSGVLAGPGLHSLQKAVGRTRDPSPPKPLNRRPACSKSQRSNHRFAAVCDSGGLRRTTW